MFERVWDLGQGIAQIGAAVTQQPQLQQFTTGVNLVFVGTRPFSAHAGTAMGSSSGGFSGRSGGGGGGGSSGMGLATTGPEGGGSNGSMRGNPPAVFSGNHSKSDEFIEDFKVYRMANQGNQMMRVPLERVTLILTYIKGKNIQDWRM
jgi:hypothetical protein